MTAEQSERSVSGKHRAGRNDKPKAEKGSKADRSPKQPPAPRPPKASKPAKTSNPARAERPRAERSLRAHGSVDRAGAGLLVTLLGLAVVCGVAALLLQQYRPTPAKQVERARTEAVKAARDDVVDILSYDYQHIDSDISKAKAEATGQFLTDYTGSAKKVLAEAAAVKAEVKSTVSAQAVVHAQADRVTVMLYVDTDTVRLLTGQKSPSTRIDPYRVQVTMSKVHGHWLVSDLQPE